MGRVGCLLIDAQVLGINSVMDKKVFKKLVGDVLKSNGFQYSNKQYHFENEELKVL